MYLSVCLCPAKNYFRVAFRSDGPLQTHFFQASDAFNKQQWLNCIRQAKEAVRDPQTDLTPTPATTWASGSG